MTTQVLDQTDLLALAEKILTRLSQENLRSAVDYLRYLEEREEWEATWELEAIPGFSETMKRASQQIQDGDVIAFEKIRRDV